MDNLHFQENAALSLESLYYIGWVCQMDGWTDTWPRQRDKHTVWEKKDWIDRQIKEME